MDKFKNQYRIASHRRPFWDYSAEALYFLTVVTQHRVCNLGSIINDVMILSPFGQIVETAWYRSFEIRGELHLHQFILMPNHLHCIVEIKYPDGKPVVNKTINKMVEVETHGRASLPPPNHPIKRNPPVRLPKSISSFMAGFKSDVNTKIDDYIDAHQLNIPKYNKTNHFFQPNYHDHIIRNEGEYQRITHYILNNPKKWKEDGFSDGGLDKMK
jgi:REP element-mobilizing transposase RayT